MSNIQVIYEQYQTLPQKAKDEFLALIGQEKANKKLKLKKRLKAMKDTESFFKSIHKDLPSNYIFDREFANER
jgi:uncharacterized protein YaaW (UPF0174 family)